MNIAIIGGDDRMLYGARVLCSAFSTCFLYGIEEKEKNFCDLCPFHRCYAPYRLKDALLRADAVLLPCPVTKDGKTLFAPFFEKPIFLREIENLIPEKALLFGGGFPSSFLHRFDGRIYDFLKEEDFQKKNALPTAESAVGLMLLHFENVIYKEKIAIFGYGKIGRELARILQGMGAEPHIFERKEEKRREAEEKGLFSHNFQDLPFLFPEFSLFFNTVPSEILGENLLETSKKDSLYIELASPPYGISEEKRPLFKGTFLMAGGLPGKYAPKFAGELMGNTLLKEYERRKQC